MKILFYTRHPGDLGQSADRGGVMSEGMLVRRVRTFRIVQLLGNRAYPKTHQPAGTRGRRTETYR